MKMNIFQTPNGLWVTEVEEVLNLGQEEPVLIFSLCEDLPTIADKMNLWSPDSHRTGHAPGHSNLEPFLHPGLTTGQVQAGEPVAFQPAVAYVRFHAPTPAGSLYCSETDDA